MLVWKDAAKELIERRKVLQARVEKIDMQDALERVMKQF